MSSLQTIEPQTQVQMHKRVLERFALLFERQTRMYRYLNSISDLVRTTHEEVGQCLLDSLQHIGDSRLEATERVAISTLLNNNVARLKRLDATLALLLREHIKQQKHDDTDLKHVMLETNRTARHLQATLIEKELFERHSQMLEKIFLSRENIRHWKRHVHDILAEFGEILAFDYFFVALSENGELSLTLFSLKLLDTGNEAVSHFCKKLLNELNLPAETPVAIEQYIAVSDLKQSPQPCPDHRQVVTALLPSLDESNSGGILGVGYSNAQGASAQQLSLIRSIMAVMAMVIGSSRALNHSLSELEYRSAHDALTGLYNRRAFTDILNDEIARSARHEHSLALLMLDLDDFKDINDTYGHLCGDLVLRTIADILQKTIRQGDFATRIGGDEFTILLPETTADGAHRVAEKLRKKIRAHVFECGDGKQFQLTVSIGFVTYPDNAMTAIDLMAGVDIGLYQAKAQGKDGVAHSDSLQEVLDVNRNARAFVEQVRSALRDDRIVAHYQPIFDCRTGRLYAHETLARMIDTSGKTLPAGAFVDTIEKYGLSRELDQTIIAQSLKSLAVRTAQPENLLRLFINLSAQEIQNRDVLAYAETLCTDLNIAPDTIVFEIMERDAISDIAQMRKFLDKLRQKGFLFALDDFGSGYNSFHYLRELTFDYVKIDGAFVKNILHSRIDYALVNNLTRLCQDIGTRTIAEFVESADILIALQKIGVDYAQGYYLGKPGATMLAMDTR